MARFIEEVEYGHDMVQIQTADFPLITYKKYGIGPAVILLHGFPLNNDLWHNIWPSLSVSYTVIVPDIPGTGRSVWKAGDISMEILAKSIKAIIDYENINNVVIVGHSIGGYIALAFAENYGKYLKGLSLVHSTAAADTEEKKEIRRKSVELINRGGKEQFVKGSITNMFAEGFKVEYPDIVQQQVKKGLELAPESMAQYYNAMAKRPARIKVLENADFPVQFIIGKEDKLINFGAVLPQSRLSNINFVSLYNNCGHMSMLEMPDKLKINIEEFVSYCYNC